MFFNPGIRKIQLWSNAQGKEFAVRLSSDHDFRAVSNPAAKYTKLVEEADYFSDMDYDWRYLLEHWRGVKNGNVKLLPDDDGDGKNPHPAAFDLPDVDDVSAVKKPNGRGAKREKPKPLLKCRYCMLSYNSEKERHEHEVTWHAEKMK
ncbi:MAG: hypothetical protein QXX64_05445 [Nitrososphaera sp.]